MSQVVGSIFVERFFDLIIIASLYTGIGIYWFHGKTPQGFPEAARGGLIVVAGLTGVLLFLQKGGHHIRKKLPARLRDVYSRFEVGTLLSLRRAPRTLALSLAIWTLEALRLFYVVKSLQLQVSPLVIMFMTLTGSLLTALPITPAGLGVVEASFVGILGLYGYPQGIAFAVAILDRLISYWSILFFGYALFLGRKQALRSAAP